MRYRVSAFPVSSHDVGVVVNPELAACKKSNRHVSSSQVLPILGNEKVFSVEQMIVDIIYDP